ncbi:hypothetical protein RHOSPDRAFT_26559 [Rhodotorula sp. JG-1b]|nr:hypothetical protein RHOSPDRAFT_26559 [Rhodotorula sp. JG-1b]
MRSCFVEHWSSRERTCGYLRNRALLSARNLLIRLDHENRAVAQLRGGSEFEVIVGRALVTGRQRGLWGVKPVVVFVASLARAPGYSRTRDVDGSEWQAADCWTLDPHRASSSALCNRDTLWKEPGMPSLLPSAATDGARRPTSHFRVQTAEYSSSNETGVTATTTGGEDAALKDTIALLDRFALSTLTRAAAASAPSVLAVKLAVIERLASPFPEPASAGSGSTRGETTELMRKALRVLDPSDWDDLIDERWAAGTCGFAACGDNPLTAPTDLGVAEPFLREARQPREAYVPREERSSLRQSRLRNVRLRGGSLVQKNLLTHSDGDGEPHSDPGAFCSDRCRIQSEYYRSLAGRGREPDRSEMWDEVERRRVEVRNSTAALRREEEEAAVASTSINLPGAAYTAAAEPRSPLHRHGIPSALSGEPSTTTPSTHRTADLPSFDNSTSAFLSTITIHEKPIRPETRPEAPSLADGNRDLERRHRQRHHQPAPALPTATAVAAGSMSTRPRASGTLGGEQLDVAVSPGKTGGGGASSSSSSSSSTTAAETGGGGAYSLPPIRFLTRPREVTSSIMSGGGSSSSRGLRSDFAAGGGARYDQDDEEEDEFAHGPVLEGIDEEHVRWLEAALLEREASAP